MTATQDYSWEQGEDLAINLVYKSGPPGEATPVDLTSYSFRMDIVAPNGKTLTVLNDETITDTDPYTPGSQADSTPYEVTMTAIGEIIINLARSLTLPPTGALFPYINANPATTSFSYDMFLRDATGKQTKILKGNITVSKSVTLWL